MLWFCVQLILFSSSSLSYSWNLIWNNEYNNSNNNSVIPATLLSSKYTEQEMNALQQFRVIVNDSILHEYEKYDSFLITWLTAKKLNMNEAANMFDKAQTWRKHNGIDTIINETILEFNPPLYTIHGFDKEGHPIGIMTHGHFDTRKLLIQGKRDKIVRILYQLLEKLSVATRMASKIFKKDITKITAILDFNGFNVRQHACLHCLSISKDVFITLEKYYPEMVGHLVLINIPRVAIPIIDIILSILSENSKKSIKFFSTDRHEWLAYLHEIIASDQLPPKYGGTLETKKNLTINNIY